MNKEGPARRCASPRLQQPVRPKVGARRSSTAPAHQTLLEKLPRRRSAGLVGIGLLVSLLSLSGCSSVPPPPTAYVPTVERSALPELDAVELARDEVARAESSISDRSRLLASLAVECEPCDVALTENASDAETRLSLSGGLWNPWGEFSEDEESDTFVEPPAEVGEAPFTVKGLVAFMAQTASQQLEEVAALPTDFVDEKEALGAILVGRLGASHALALSFGTEVGKVGVLDEAATLVYAPSDSSSSQDDALDGADASKGSIEVEESSVAEEPESEGPGKAGTEGEVSETAQSGSVVEGTQDPVASAIAKLDCARSTLLTLPVEDQQVDGVLDFASTLENRNRTYLKAGAADVRPLRCLSQDASIEELLEDVVTQDLTIFTIGEPEIAGAAAEGLVEALEAWVALSPKTLPTVTVWPDAELSGVSENE